MLFTLNIQNFVPLPDSFKFWVGCLHHLFWLVKQPLASSGNDLGNIGDDDVGRVSKSNVTLCHIFATVPPSWLQLINCSKMLSIYSDFHYLIQKTIKCIGVKAIVMFDYFWHIKSSYYWRVTAQFHLPHKSDLTQVTHFGGSTGGVYCKLVVR